MEFDNNIYRELFAKMPDAFAYHQVIYDQEDNPVDYLFLEINDAFEQLTGLKREVVIGKKVTEVHPEIGESAFDWIDVYGQVAKEGKSIRFEQYFEPADRWYDVSAFSGAPGYFATVFTEITKRKEELASMRNLLELTEKLFDTDLATFDYQPAADNLLKLSGAKFAAINTYEEDCTKTVTRAISGIPSMIESASKILGFKIAGQAWEIIPERRRKIEGGKLVRFSSLHETAMGSLNKTTSTMLHKLTGIGDIYVIELAYSGRATMGDIIFFMPKGKGIYNREVIEIYAGQLGAVLGRLKSEEKLLKNEQRLSLAQVNARAGYWEYDIKKERLYWSRECEALFGLDEGEFEGTFDAFLKRIHPDDKEYVLSKNQPITESREGTLLEYEHRIIKKDGTVIWVRETADVINDESGKAAFVTGLAMEITERKQAEEEIRESEARLNQFFSQSLTGFFFMMLDEPVTWDETTDKEKTLDYAFHHQRMTKVNQAMLDQYGASEDDFIGKTPYDLFKHDLDHGRYIWRGLFNKGHWKVETDERRMDGTPITIDGDYICLYDSEGRITGHFGVQVDVTEQKQDQEELYLQRERLSNIVEGANVATWEWNVQTGEHVIDKRWAEMIGYNLNDIYNGSIETWHDFTHPEDLKISYREMEKHFNGELDFYNVECRRKHKDGHWIWVNDRGKVISWTEDGKPLWVFGTLINITERKKAEEALQESEQRYREILETTAEGFYEVDLKGNIVACNRAAAKMLGFKQEEVIGLNYKSLCKDFDAVFRKFNQAFASGKSKFNVLLEMIRKDGSINIADLSVALTYDQQGNITGFRGMGRDITERVQLEEHLKHLSLHDELTGLYNRRYFKNELARLDRSRDYPVAVISADLDGLKLINDTLGHAEGDRYLQAGADLLMGELRASDILARVGGDEFAIILPRTDHEAAEEIVIRLRARIDQYNSQQQKIPISISIGLAVSTTKVSSLEETYKEADNAMYNDKLKRSPLARAGIVDSLVKTLSTKKNLGEGQNEQVEELSERFGRYLQLGEKEFNNLMLLAKVYDLGKVNMPDQLVHIELKEKEGELTTAEQETIRRHPEVGYRIATSSPKLSEVADLILRHHENYDGSGYPLGLKGNDIALECRIMAIITAYSAMTNHRPYAKKLKAVEALEELKRCAGTQFDPQLVEKFLALLASESK